VLQILLAIGVDFNVPFSALDGGPVGERPEVGLSNKMVLRHSLLPIDAGKLLREV
jgi:hypothetical protein